jgi:SAM-dependent methyltransferase
MSLTVADIEFLRSDRAREYLAGFNDFDLSAAAELPLLSQLRTSLKPRQASAILQTLKLRAKAETKFPRHAQKMLFTDAGLQQASQPAISQYRASKLATESVLDLCCGIGADTLAFAAAGLDALGLDIDPVRIAIARHNAEALGNCAHFDLADVNRSIPAGYASIFFDPARRDERGRRLHDVERYRPPLSLVREWKAREILVKLSPAVDLRQLDAYGGCVEFISLAGNLCEALLWLNQPSAPPKATQITSGGALHFYPEYAARAEISPPRGWLIEPDPAIIRAGLVQNLAADLSAALLDETIAYVTCDRKPDTPWGRCWQILDWLPFQLKRLRRYLAERRVGKVTVKKRGFPMSPEELIARLRLTDGEEERVVVMTRHRGRAIAIICAAMPFGQNERIPYNGQN